MRQIIRQNASKNDEWKLKYGNIPMFGTRDRSFRDFTAFIYAMLFFQAF